MPRAAELVGMVVQSHELWEGYGGELGSVCGFDHALMDKVLSLGGAAKPQREASLPLWMYRFTPLTAPFALLSMDFCAPLVDFAVEGDVPFVCDGVAHAVVTWVRYRLDQPGDEGEADGEREWLSTGLESGRMCRYWRQGVSFLPAPLCVQDGSAGKGSSMHFQVKVSAADARVTTTFQAAASEK